VRRAAELHRAAKASYAKVAATARALHCSSAGHAQLTERWRGHERAEKGLAECGVDCRLLAARFMRCGRPDDAARCAPLLGLVDGQLAWLAAARSFRRLRAERTLPSSVAKAALALREKLSQLEADLDTSTGLYNGAGGVGRGVGDDDDDEEDAEEQEEEEEYGGGHVPGDFAVVAKAGRGAGRQGKGGKGKKGSKGGKGAVRGGGGGGSGHMSTKAAANGGGASSASTGGAGGGDGWTAVKKKRSRGGLVGRIDGC